MKSTETKTGKGSSKSEQRRLRWSGLQSQMTISYVWVTVVSVLVLELLLVIILTIVAYPLIATTFLLPQARQTAGQFALAASIQAKGSNLDPRANFRPHEPGTLLLARQDPPATIVNIPYLTVHYPENQLEPFALLIARNGQVIASSYPQRYPVNTIISTLLPDRTESIADALSGSGEGKPGLRAGQNVVYALEPVWNKDEKPIGAIYVEIPTNQPLTRLADITPLLRVLLASAFLLLLITPPIGTVFGLITTRKLVRRIHTLVHATTQFADENYQQRVKVERKDEVGQLEAHFNRMAEQLVESIARRQELAEQNARMAERARISRELHDAISQDLFSLRMLAGGLEVATPADSALRPQILMLKQSTTTMIREMRALLLELRPAQLEQLGLVAALEDLAAAYRARLGIEVKVNIAAVPLTAESEHTILRVAQEALSNAARHADASIISIELRPEEEHSDIPPDNDSSSPLIRIDSEASVAPILTDNDTRTPSKSKQFGKEASSKAQSIRTETSNKAQQFGTRASNKAESSRKEVLVTITDNGRGFEPQEPEGSLHNMGNASTDQKFPREHGLGLRTMRERVQELHGSFILESAPGQGTRICLRLPQERAE